MDLKKSFEISKTDLTIYLLIIFLVFISVFGSRTHRLTSNSAFNFVNETEIIMYESTGLDSLVVKLHDKNVQFSESDLIWASKLLGWRNFQRGRYLFEGPFGYNDLLSKMGRGIQDAVKITIPPGITPERLADRLSDNLHFQSETFLNTFRDSLMLNDLQLTKEQLMGRMLPETYLMYWTWTPKNVIDRIHREFNRLYDHDLIAKTKELNLTIDEVLALASIIEWEANISEEKRKISGLYWNRLNRGMYLQADPTVNFALGERRRLLYEDYKFDHPFNTYTNLGLPPAAITNPSLSSIKAALEPEEHDFLYMVANPKGGHTFTETFAEHQVESEKWRRWLREQYRIKEAREREAEFQNSE